MSDSFPVSLKQQKWNQTEAAATYLSFYAKYSIDRSQEGAAENSSNNTVIIASLKLRIHKTKSADNLVTSLTYTACHLHHRHRQPPRWWNSLPSFLHLVAPQSHTSEIRRSRKAQRLMETRGQEMPTTTMGLCGEGPDARNILTHQVLGQTPQRSWPERVHSSLFWPRFD
jgi:hypothetical protein